MNDGIQKTNGPAPDRRGFLKRAAAAVLGALVGLVPMGAGLWVMLDPLRRKGGGGQFLRVASVNALPEDESPRRFPVLADRQDAWNKFPHDPVGAVYLRRTTAGKVEALNVTCPHAGCPVGFEPATSSFLCPCHNSRFKLDGALADLRSPSPRGMDSLEVEVRAGGEVWVKFQNFEAGKARKVPLG